MPPPHPNRTMLVISRKVGETLVIGGADRALISITLLAISEPTGPGGVRGGVRVRTVVMGEASEHDLAMDQPPLTMPLPLDESASLRICSIRTERARLGVELPREFVVHRKEFWDQMHP